MLKKDRLRKILRLRVGPQDVPDLFLRRYMLLLFFVSSGLFLWTPTRWMVESFQRYLAFQSHEFPGDWPASQPVESRSSDLTLLGPKIETATRPAKKPRAVMFRLLAPAAKQVFLGGTFNDFDARKHPMTRRSDGLWEITLDLPPGRYVYKFKVDGRWELDPSNPERTPEPRASSLLEIR